MRAALEDAGLYDPASPTSGDRLELLDILVQHDIPIEEMVAADAEGTLAFMLAPRLIRPGIEQLSARDVAARAGMDLDEALALWRTVGLADLDPDEPVLSERVVEPLQLFGAAKEIYGPEIVMQIARTLGASIARIAEALPPAFSARFAETGEESEARIAQVDAELSATLPMLVNAVDVLLRYHLQAAIKRWLLNWSGTHSATQARGIGFCDLVGFTSFSQELSNTELARHMDRFETDACEVVNSRGGRVVKLIGDEIMFTAGDAGSICDISISLVERFADHPALPPLRGGVAFGDVLSQEGDYYGATVNLASRLVKLAGAGVVLAPKTIEAGLGADGAITTVPHGSRRVKGFPETIDVVEVTRRG